MENRKCEYCGGPMPALAISTAKYCSKKCRNAMYRKNLAPRKCEKCGEMFKTSSPHARYCPDCRSAARGAKISETWDKKTGIGKIDPKYLRRWGPDGPKYHRTGSSMFGEFVS